MVARLAPHRILEAAYGDPAPALARPGAQLIRSEHTRLRSR